MKVSGKCPRCGGTDIIADAKAVDRGEGNGQHEMIVVTYRKPDVLPFAERQESKVSAWVCGSCGYLEFYADTPHAIRVPK